MKKLHKYTCALFMLSVVFPYTQILPLQSYNQPYSYILAFLLLRPRQLPLLPRAEKWVILLYALTGTVLFVYYCLPGPVFQEYKYLLNFVAPLVLLPVTLEVALRYPVMIEKIVFYGIMVWLFVAVVQFVFDPNFLTQLIGRRFGIAGDFVASGRGVLSFAPEPTHHGLHIGVLIAMYVMIGNFNRFRMLMVAALVDIVFLAKSSGALFAFGCGGLIWGITSFKKYALYIFVSSALFLAGIFLLINYGDESLRIVYLLKIGLSSGIDMISYDYSSNARLGGLYLAYKESISNFLIPHGLSHAEYLAENAALYMENLWLIGLSETGFPTGFGLILYQAGFFALPLIVLFFVRIVNYPSSPQAKYLAISMFFIFNMQYYLSTPGFSVFWGLMIANYWNERDKLMERAR